MPVALIETIIRSLNQEVLGQLDLTRSIKHPGENGRAREQIISEYLKKILPNNVKIDTGFVIDARGSISNQIDIVIYRDDYHPVIEIGRIKHFMVESVIAVIENKASITSSAVLQSALKNIQSVKSLDRANGSYNKIVPSGKTLNRNDFQHQIFGAIITERSLSTQSLREEFIKFFNSNPDFSSWTNMYTDVRGSSVRYITEDFIATAIPSAAFGFIISDPNAENYTPPLLEITFELLNLIRVAPLVDYNPCDYFYGTVGSSKASAQFPPEVMLAASLVRPQVSATPPDKM